MSDKNLPQFFCYVVAVICVIVSVVKTFFLRDPDWQEPLQTGLLFILLGETFKDQ